MNNLFKMKRKRLVIFLTGCALLCIVQANAQVAKDTSGKQSVQITSAYKPVLRNAVKLNLSATHLNADTSRPSLTYTIPAQNLFYSYQPVPLKPLALQADTNLDMGIRNYVKAGFGNFSTPYVQAGFSFGDGKKALFNLYAGYIASKGKIKFQDYSIMNLKAAGSLFTAKQEAYFSAAISQNDHYLYGYNHTLYPSYTKDALQQKAQNIELKAGIRNKVLGEYGISYNPNITVSNFNLKDKLSESTLILEAPIKKTFGNSFAFKLNAKADITNYTTKNYIPTNLKYSNNVMSVAPSLMLLTPKVTVNAGVTPTWDNGTFVLLPNVYAEAQIQDKVFLVQAGWVGNLVKNIYRNLHAINPWLHPYLTRNNTKEMEIYGGIKATLGKHFNFNAKAGFITYENLPFFINDTATDLKYFKIANEAKANNLRIHGDMSYINQDKFTLNAGITFNGYTGMTNNAKAWNTVPLELNASMRWWAFKQVLLKADLYSFGGGNYIDKGNLAKSFNGGTDFSAGIEFKINKMFSAWFDVNNILNSKYERWHNYEVYGLNFLGGVRVAF